LCGASAERNLPGDHPPIRLHSEMLVVRPRIQTSA
jgi:hypothetical protein